MAQSSTVAQISALINASLTIVKLTYPLLVSWIAASSLKPKTNAATWSVFGKLINDSLWPTLLRTDTASSLKVHKRTQALSWISTIAGWLLAIAAVVTPLGLHDTLKTKQSDGVPFYYVKDTFSPIGRATPSRDSYNLSRTCGYYLWEPCPGHSDGYTITDAFLRTPILGEEQSDIIWTSVPANITEVFNSGADSGEGIAASAFDIEYRYYMNFNRNYSEMTGDNYSILDDGKPRTRGRFRYAQDFKLEDRVRAIEGLIVSTVDGSPKGVGIRNHTLPNMAYQGYQWEEKILWLEPITECTDLNVTLDYIQNSPDDFNLSSAHPRLTDRGGFVNLPTEYPELDLNDTQNDPMLAPRSWKAAVLTNNIVRRALNETRNATRLGKAYYLNDVWGMPSSYTGALNPYGIAFSTFGYENFDPDEHHPNLPGSYLFELSSSEVDLNLSARFQSNTSSYYPIDSDVNFGAGHKLNISIAGSVGGLMLSAGFRVDSDGEALPTDDHADNEVPLDVGIKWQQRLYACMSGVKASMKVVRFELRGNGSLEDLSILSIVPSNQTSLWAMENTHRNLSQLDPFWGVVSERYKNSPNISTIERSYFFLPAGQTSAKDGGLAGSDGAAGTSAPLAALNDIYSLSSFDSGPQLGTQNWALSEKWSSLSRNATAASKIIDIIWTDLMANAVVGTRSPFAQQNGSSASFANVPVTYFIRGVSYDWRFAIPALVFVTAYIALLVASIVLTCTRKSSFATLKSMLNQSAAGRTLTIERSLGKDPADMALTKQWAMKKGDELVRLLDAESTPPNAEEVLLRPQDDEQRFPRDPALHERPVIALQPMQREG